MYLVKLQIKARALFLKISSHCLYRENRYEQRTIKNFTDLGNGLSLAIGDYCASAYTSVAQIFECTK